MLAGHQRLEVVHQTETQPGTWHRTDRHEERVAHGSGDGEPAALLTCFHLKPLFTAWFTPAAHHPEGLVGINLGQGRSLLIRCGLQNLATNAEQWLTRITTTHIR
jgi:hypothetical protein